MEKNDVYDFYYSRESWELYEWLDQSHSDCDKVGRNYINGKRYTECVSKGDKPKGDFSNYILAHSGYIRDISVVF